MNRFKNIGSKELPPQYENRLSLKERARAAENEARPLAEVEAEDERSALLISNFISGRIGLQEFIASDSLKFEDLRPGEVELADLIEMRDFLRDLLKDDALAQELTDHEEEHLSRIVEIGWRARLLFRFFKNDKGRLSGRPGVIPDIPKVGDEEDIRSKLKSIIEAAHDLSDTDDLAVKNH